MSAARAMPALISADVELVRAQLDKIKAVDAICGPIGSDAARKETVQRLRIAGAIVVQRDERATVQFRGVKASSGLGLVTALDKWRRAAARRLQVPA